MNPHAKLTAEAWCKGCVAGGRCEHHEKVALACPDGVPF